MYFPGMDTLAAELQKELFGSWSFLQPMNSTRELSSGLA